MKFQLPNEIRLFARFRADSRCAEYALSELVRLLTALGRTVEVSRRRSSGFRLQLGALQSAPKLTGIHHDGFVLTVERNGVDLAARNAKGLLNAVYELAEQLGVAFVEPGAKGEWVPETPQPLALGTQRWTPRFAWRGTCFSSLHDFPVAEWLKFHAKLKLNGAFIAEPENFAAAQAVVEQLGLRLELGQHGFRELLPRSDFEKHPERFRMHQPEDFGGRRVADYNCCVTHPETQRLLAENFRKFLDRIGPAYAVHCWPDDLPGSGWCLCPSCRSLTNSDQAQLVMRILGHAARDCGHGARISMLAYHDTMFPGELIAPDDTNFLLFAPRERCYGHGLGDDACPRNRHYLEALRRWRKRFRGIPDSHVFEYYFDQILFRGMYFFLPRIILEDLKTYAAYGIESYFPLQVAGPLLAPEYNLAVFVRAQWDEQLTVSRVLTDLARSLAPEHPGPFRRYLAARAAAFQLAAQTCEHQLGIYLDYRWLPESDTPFGRRVARHYRSASDRLRRAAGELAAAYPDASPRLADLIRREVARAEFEAAELSGMAAQQTGLNALGHYHNTGKAADRRAAVTAFRQAIERFERSRELAERAGIPADAWYFHNVNDWQRRELREKADKFDF